VSCDRSHVSACTDPTPALALVRVCSSFRITGVLVGLGRLDPDVPPADAFTRFASSGSGSALRFIALASSPATARTHRSNRPNRELRASTSRPARWNACAPSSASLEVFVPSAHVSRVALRCSKAAGSRTVPLRRFRRPCGFSLIARSMRCSSNWRTCGVGRSVFRHSHPRRERRG